jgi:twitching motility protein PilT
LHTNSAAQTIDRIIDVFPANQQSQIKIQLSSALEAILSQRLLPSLAGGRIPTVEILINTPAVANAIREGKTQMIETILQTSFEMGNRTLEMDLARLVKEGKVSLETAKSFALRPEELMRLTKGR